MGYGRTALAHSVNDSIQGVFMQPAARHIRLAEVPTPSLDLAIRVVRGSLTGKTTRFQPEDVAEGVMLGHGDGCGIQFDERRDQPVARHHAILVQRGAEIWLQDLAGMRDVLVDGRLVPAGGARLREASRIQLGRLGPAMVVNLSRPAVARPTPTARPQEALPRQHAPITQGTPIAQVAPIAQAAPIAPMVLVPAEVAQPAVLRPPPPPPRRERPSPPPTPAQPAIAQSFPEPHLLELVPAEVATPPQSRTVRIDWWTRAALFVVLVCTAATGLAIRTDDLAERDAAASSARSAVSQLRERTEQLRRAETALAAEQKALADTRTRLGELATGLYPEGPPLDDPQARQLANARRAITALATGVADPPR
jgi:hypothetical protein